LLNQLYLDAKANGAGWLEDTIRKANGAKLSMDDLKKANLDAVHSIENVGVKSSFKNGLKNLAGGLLKGLTNGLISGLISWGINTIADAIDGLIETHAEKLERWAKDIETLSGSLDEYKTSQSSVNEELDRYKALNQELSSGTLTIEEYREAKSELLTIQDSIIDKYDLEANSIDLVNGRLEKNLELLEKLQTQEWTDWYAENKPEIDSSKEFLDDSNWVQEMDAVNTHYTKGTLTKEFENLLSKYKLLESTNGTNKTVSFENFKNREEAYKNISKFYNELISGNYEQEGTDVYGNNLYDFIVNASEDALRAIDTEQTKNTRSYLDQIFRNSALFGAHKSEYSTTETVIEELLDRMSSGIVDNETFNSYKEALDDFNTKKSEMDSDTIAAFNNLFEDVDGNMAEYSNKMYNAINSYKILTDELKQGGFTSDQLSKGITDGLSASALAQLDALNEISKEYGYTIEDTANYLLKLGHISETVFASIQKDLGSVKTTFNTFSEDLTAINEMLSSGSTLSIENYEKLVAMGSEYIDTLELQGDKLVVNADRMNDLVDARIKDQKATLKQSKSYSQLEYDRLSKELRNLVNRYDQLDDSQKEHAIGLFGMLDDLDSTITQYDLLATALDEAGSAFARYTDAKSQAAYGEKYNTASDAFKSIDAGFTSGKVGTKEFEAAVAAMIPEISRQDIDAVYDYYINELSKFFKYNSDGNLTREGLENFVQEALDAGGLLTEDSTLEDFTIANGVKLQDFADNLGLTKEAVVALFGALEEYGYGKNFDFTDELIKNLGDDYQGLQEITNEIYKERQKLMEEGKWTKKDGSYTEEALENIENANAALDKESEIVDNLRDKFVNYDDNVAEASQLTTKLSNTLKEQSKYEVGSDQWNEYQTKVDNITTRLAELKNLTETPTEFEVQLVIEDIDSEIDELNAQIAGVAEELQIRPNAELQGQFDYLVAKRDELLEEKEMVMKLDDSEVQDLMADVQDVIEMCENGTIFEIDTTKAVKKLQLLKNYAESVRKIIQNIDQHAGDYTTYDDKSGPGSEFRATGTLTGTERRNLSNVLGGELGPEMQVRDGQYRIIGKDGPELFDIKKDDIIFNHKQTADLLKRRKAYGRGLAFSGGLNNGPARASGSLEWKSGWMRDWATILGGGSGSGSGASDAFSELIDEIEILLGRLDTYISRLSTLSSDLYQTYQGKNKIVDEQIAANADKLTVLDKAYDRYILEANKVGLSEYWKKMVQAGQIDIESITDEELYNKVQEYQNWYNKAEALKDSILETHSAIRQLNNTKLENITNSFDQMVALQESFIAKQTAANTLVEVMGGDVSEKSYRKLMETQAEITNYLTGKRDRLQKQFDKMLSEGSIKPYTEDWMNWKTAIGEVEASITEATASTYEYIEAIRDTRWKGFNDQIKDLEEIESELSSIESLLGSIETHNENGSLTNAGKTMLGTYAQQLATSKQKSAEYQNAIDALKRELDNGNISQNKYNELIEEYSSAQRQAASDTKAARDAIVDLIKNGIEKETEAYSNLIDAKRKDLEATRDYQDYAKSLSEKQESINAIKAQISALSGNEENKTAVKKLQNQLMQLNDEYLEMKKDHEYDLLIQGYDDQLEAFEENQDAEMERLTNDLDYQSEAITSYLETLKDNYTDVYDYLGLLTEVYGQQFSENVTGSWDDATSAVQTYIDAVNKAQSQAGIDSSKISVPSVSGKDLPTVKEETSDKLYSSLNTPTTSSKPSSSSSSSKNNPKVSKTTGLIGYGDSGSSVSLLQDALNKLGYNAGKVDGIFGDKTYAALVKFQSAKGISADGILGDETRKKFKEAGFFGGGLVAAAMNRMVKLSGEDGIAFVRNKEAILNPEQTRDFKQLVHNLQPINNMVDYLIKKSPANLSGNQSNMVFHIDQHIDHIDTFSRDLSSVLTEHTKKSAEYTVNLIKQQGRKLGYK
jgi:DNA repair exonuclease SbcCD ATPase subunit